MARPKTVWTAAILGLWQCGYMVFDGLHELTTGRYFGSRLGPWATVVSTAGMDYRKMSVPFLVLGSAWLIGSALLLARVPVSRITMLVLGLASLFYVIFGTLISLIVILCVMSPQTKAAALARTNSRRMP
jgi:hypothetical protein